ncbi:hypothetical protein [Siminovitchia terrae]|uniref:hypothetical protein n=1 Tax=Siminovitchia terrae TaxID=1914933 RepID=UPI001BB3BB4D|nr:hypothetical protein [Siminovitchia terrae]
MSFYIKASGGCHRFSKGIYRAEPDKIWAQIRQGAFDICHFLGNINRNCRMVTNI